MPDQDTDCETWQRLYFESIDCFGPYRTVRGGIKPEAFERCNEVPEPPVSRCRLRLPIAQIQIHGASRCAITRARCLRRIAP